MAFQFFNPTPVYFDLLGIEPIMGGSITFYDKGTTTLRNTWSREEQGDEYLNTNPIILDAAGRSPVQIWMDGDYSYVIKEADGAVVRTGDFTSGQAPGAALPPSLLPNGFLTNDGTNTLWTTIRQVPDPTGMNDRVLGTDGANLLWRELPAIPEPPEADVGTTATSFWVGDMHVQMGNGVAPASGGFRTSRQVSFPQPFQQPPLIVSPTVNTTQIAHQCLVAIAVVDITATGCNVVFDVADRHGDGAYITNSIPFTYSAIGKKLIS